MARTKTVSYSEIDTYRQCPLKHQLAYLEMWGTDDTAEALARGTLFHSVMEAHYGVLRDMRAGDPRALMDGYAEDVYLAVAPLLHEEGTGAQSERQELVEWMYRGYIEHYGSDPDWQVVEIERQFEAWIPTPAGTRSSFKLVGTIDMIVRDMSAGGGLWIVDHKTCKNLPRGKDLDMEDQTALYTYLLKSKGYDIRGAIYNHCRTDKLKRDMTMDERFRRTLTVRTDDELRTMVSEAYDEMLEAYKPRLRDARRRPDGERCGWKCGFTEACLTGRKYGGEKMREFLEDTGYERQENKPGPTFTKLAEMAANEEKPL